MSTWFRVYNRPDPRVVFSGDGGLYVAGRWNQKGRRAVYCSASIALASLEWLGRNGCSVLGFSSYRFSIDVPDKLIVRYAANQLPPGWDAEPLTAAGQDFFETALFNAGGPVGIAVPSVVIPEEYNLVLNAMHDAFAKTLTTVNELGLHEMPRRA